MNYEGRWEDWSMLQVSVRVLSIRRGTLFRGVILIDMILGVL